jgi:hypothetical protein
VEWIDKDLDGGRYGMIKYHPGMTQETHEELGQDNRCTDQHLCQAHPESES